MYCLFVWCLLLSSLRSFWSVTVYKHHSGFLPLHIVIAALRHDNPKETPCFIVRPWPLVLFEVLHVQWKFPCGLQFPFHSKRHPVWINTVKFQSNNLTTQPSFSRFNFFFYFYNSSLTLLSSAILTCLCAWFFAWEEVFTAANQSFISSFTKTNYQQHVSRKRHYKLV